MKRKALFCILAALLSSQPQLSSCFWLTDSSLFQSQLAESAKSQVAPAKTNEFEALKTNELLVSRPQEQTELASNWIREQPRQPAQANECQCNLTWLQNQTNSWLNQWMSSAQMRFASSATGAAQQSFVARRQLEPAHHQQRNAHWSARNRSDTWLRKRNLAAAAAQVAPGARKLEPEQQQQEPSNFVARAERGPQGPTGETGARGERGPQGERGSSGLIGVRDLRALFDLEQSDKPLLVFIESKQILVLRTRLGWRPVPLLAPLRRSMRAKQHAKEGPQTKFLLGAQNGKEVNERKSAAQGVGSSAPTRRAQSDENQKAATFEEANDDDDDGDEEQEDEDEDADADEEEEEEENDDEEELEEEEEAKLDKRLEAAQLRGQVSEKKLLGRSAAALVSASIENSPTSLLAKQALGEQQKMMTNGAAGSGAGPKLRLAALNEPFSGNVHGIRGADFECKRNAARANLRGSFRAFLAAGFQNLNELVRHNNANKYAVVNLRGETLASSWHDFFKQPARFSNPLSRVYSFDGRLIATDSNWPNKLVWHGATNKAGYRDLVSNCDGWHSDSLNRFGLATPIHSPKAYRERQQLREAALKAQRRKINKGSDSLAQGENLAQYSDDEDENSTRNSNSSWLVNGGELGHVFETIGKYPCRMPLIVLCIETVGQQLSSDQFKSDFEANNIGLL